MAINVFTASGNIGRDAEQRWTPSGKAVAHFSLPVKQGYGEHEKTSWVKCVLLGAKAEKLPQHLTKGTKVTVTGEFVMEEWTDQQGSKRSAPSIIVSSIDFGASKSADSGHSGNQQRSPQQQQSNPPMDFDDQDIPF